MSWFGSVRNFFRKLIRRQDNRVRPSPEEELMPSAERDEINEWRKEMEKDSRNRKYLREMRKWQIEMDKLRKRELKKMKKIRKSKEKGGHTHDDDKLKKKSRGQSLQEMRKWQIEMAKMARDEIMMTKSKEGHTHDDDKLKRRFGVTKIKTGKDCLGESDSDPELTGRCRMISSYLQYERENHSQVEKSDIGSGSSEEKQIGKCNDDTHSDVSSKLDRSESSQEDVESTSEGHPVLDKDNDKTGGEGEDENTPQDDTDEGKEEKSRGQDCEEQLSFQSEDNDSESGHDLITRKDNSSADLEDQDSVQRIDMDAQEFCDKSQEKARGRRRVSKDSFFQEEPPGLSFGKGQEQGADLSVHFAETIEIYVYDITPTRSYERVGTSSMSVSGTDSPRTENWAEVVGSNSENEGGQCSKIIEQGQKPLSSQVQVTASDEDKEDLQIEQCSDSEEKKTEETEGNKLHLKSVSWSPDVDKLEEDERKSKGFLRRSFEWIGRKITPKKKKKAYIHLGGGGWGGKPKKPGLFRCCQKQKQNENAIFLRDEKYKKMLSSLLASWDAHKEDLCCPYPGGYVHCA